MAGRRPVRRPVVGASDARAVAWCGMFESGRLVGVSEARRECRCRESFVTGEAAGSRAVGWSDSRSGSRRRGKRGGAGDLPAVPVLSIIHDLAVDMAVRRGRLEWVDLGRGTVHGFGRDCSPIDGGGVGSGRPCPAGKLHGASGGPQEGNSAEDRGGPDSRRELSNAGGDDNGSMYGSRGGLGPADRFRAIGRGDVYRGRDRGGRSSERSCAEPVDRVFQRAGPLVLLRVSGCCRGAVHDTRSELTGWMVR